MLAFRGCSDCQTSCVVCEPQNEDIARTEHVLDADCQTEESMMMKSVSLSSANPGLPRTLGDGITERDTHPATSCNDKYIKFDTDIFCKILLVKNKLGFNSDLLIFYSIWN